MSRRRGQVEIVVDTVGIYVRGFAAGVTFGEALDELDRTLRRRLSYARERARSRAGLTADVPPARPVHATGTPVRSLPVADVESQSDQGYGPGQVGAVRGGGG